MRSADFNDMEGMVGSSTSTTPQTEALKEHFRTLIQPFASDGSIIPLGIFEKNYATYGPEVMIDVLNEDRLCHVQAHNLGRVIFTHTNDLVSSLAICQNKCTEGCIHGVLMGLFHTPLTESDPSPEELTPTMQRKIGSMCDNADITRYTGLGNCYHALGHVVGSLTENDVPKAIALCQSIFKPEGIGAVFYCATGVYMQLDITLGDVHVRQSGGDIFPCDTNLYPAACYRYRLYRAFQFPEEYKQASDFCMSLSGAKQRGCFNAIGADAYRMVQKDPAALNQLCSAGDDLDKQMCVEGVLGMLKVYFPQSLQAACDLYVVGDKAMCTRAAGLYIFSMNRDFTLYAQ